jgi:3-oxoacyl-ACP reductase-like protein
MRAEDAQRPMADYLFVPQSVLDKWSEQGRIEVDGNVLTILGDHKSFALTSAVRFIKMEAGEDNASLLAKVKTTDALKQMGAEHYMESVILGESAYQVQQGFLADANALRRAAAASQAQAPKAPGSAPAKPAGGANPASNPQGVQGDEKGDEQDMLEQFLLDNL